MAEGTTLTWMSCGHVSVTNMIDIDHLLNILSTFFIILIHFVAILSILGPRDVVICGLAQYAMLWGTMIGYTITTATSIMWEFYRLPSELITTFTFSTQLCKFFELSDSRMLKWSEQFRAVVRTNCFHYNGRDASCGASGTLYMVLFGLVEIVLSQFPNLEKITLLSVIAAVMSFTYSFIGLFLSIAKFASHHSVRGTLLGVKIGVDGVSASTKTWHSLQALGNIAFAYTYAMLLIEIQVVR